CRVAPLIGKLMKSRKVTARLSCGGGVAVCGVQYHPDSTWHVDEQPSPFVVFPSSHCSGGSRMPSPHFERHVPELQSGSSVHCAEHPSPSIRLPSSQGSLPSLMPLPHVVFMHIEGGGAPESGLRGAGGVQNHPGSNVHVAEQPFPGL